MLWIPGEVQLKNAIAISYANGLRVGGQPDAEDGGEDSAVVVKRNMAHVRNEDDGQVQAGVVPDDDWRRAPYLIYSECTHLHIYST